VVQTGLVCPLPRTTTLQAVAEPSGTSPSDRWIPDQSCANSWKMLHLPACHRWQRPRKKHCFDAGGSILPSSPRPAMITRPGELSVPVLIGGISELVTPDGRLRMTSRLAISLLDSSGPHCRSCSPCVREREGPREQNCVDYREKHEMWEGWSLRYSWRH
jgi:hypothetical protein